MAPHVQHLAGFVVVVTSLIAACLALLCHRTAPQEAADEQAAGGEPPLPLVTVLTALLGGRADGRKTQTQLVLGLSCQPEALLVWLPSVPHA